MTVNWVGGEPRLACCVCDNYQQAINTRAALRFLHVQYWIGTEPQNLLTDQYWIGPIYFSLDRSNTNLL